MKLKNNAIDCIPRVLRSVVVMVACVPTSYILCGIGISDCSIKPPLIAFYSPVFDFVIKKQFVLNIYTYNNNSDARRLYEVK